MGKGQSGLMRIHEAFALVVILALTSCARTVLVETDPTDATITYLGKEYSSPAKILVDRNSNEKISITADWYEAQYHTLNPRETPKLQVSLEPIVWSLTVHSSPEGATITYRDQEYTSPANINLKMALEDEITVYAKGYDRKVVAIDLDRLKTDIRVSLERNRAELTPELESDQFFNRLLESLSTSDFDALSSQMKPADADSLFWTISPEKQSAEKEILIGEFLGYLSESRKWDELILVLELCPIGHIPNSDPDSRYWDGSLLEIPILENESELLSKLIDAGAEIDMAFYSFKNYHNTDLMRAIRAKSYDCIDVLLEKGSDINLPIVSRDHATGGFEVEYAIFEAVDDPIAMKMLLDRGADISVQEIIADPVFAEQTDSGRPGFLYYEGLVSSIELIDGEYKRVDRDSTDITQPFFEYRPVPRNLQEPEDPIKYESSEEWDVHSILHFNPVFR